MIKNRRVFTRITPEFIETLKTDIESGYSMSYASRMLVGGLNRIRRNFNAYPQLKTIYDWYSEKQRTKVKCFK
jgi:hypothetical protein